MSSMLDYPFDPPFLTVETQQLYLKDKIWIDNNEYVKAPDKPGLGVEIDEEPVKEYNEVTS